MKDGVIFKERRHGILAFFSVVIAWKLNIRVGSWCISSYFEVRIIFRFRCCTGELLPELIWLSMHLWAFISWKFLNLHEVYLLDFIFLEGWGDDYEKASFSWWFWIILFNFGWVRQRPGERRILCKSYMFWGSSCGVTYEA